MLAIALAAALTKPALLADGMPIVHFHGYPDPDWFDGAEHFCGVRNPHFPCGTVQSALLAFREMTALCAMRELRIGCIVEPGHGSIFVASGVELLVERLLRGCGVGGGARRIELGGRHFPALLAATSLA
jgi:hypothetical protein